MNRQSNRGRHIGGAHDHNPEEDREGDFFIKMRDDNPRLSYADEEDKIAFVRKVYGILMTQLLITACACLLPYLDRSIQIFMLRNTSIIMFTSIFALMITCGLFCIPTLARKAPTNYILMFAFTFCEAYSVAYVCASVNSPEIVIIATFMTAGIVIALTLYAFTTEQDFTVFGGLAFVIIAIFIMLGFFSYLFGPTMRLIYCGIGVLIFSFYLIMDTQYIVGSGKYQLDRDDYILAAIILYIDIINIFLYVLQFLTQLMQGKE